MRRDFTEITFSPVTHTPTVHTWIYFDACTYDGEACTDTYPLSNAYDANGNPITEKFDGSRYFRWDHTDSKMKVDTVLEGEQNSDTPSVLQAFVEHAVTDCVAKGATEYFLALSSHGGGFIGYGGDNNTGRRRRLDGLQSNKSIVTAISSALANVPGGPAMLDVLGFDACLMQSAGALDDFKGITKYHLASEATEPGHGAYIALLDRLS